MSVFKKRVREHKRPPLVGAYVKLLFELFKDTHLGLSTTSRLGFHNTDHMGGELATSELHLNIISWL